MKVKGDSSGQRLRMLRQHLGKSQAALASEFGISGSTLSRYETDVREPDIDFFILLRSKTGVDLNWLFCAEGEMFPTIPKDIDSKLALVQKILYHAKEIFHLLTLLQRF